MAIYHLRVKVITRMKGNSAVSAAAYRSGEVLRSDREGITKRSGKRQRVIHKEILAPRRSPSWVMDREKLWNAVERAEVREDAQLSREFEIALMHELSLAQNLAWLRQWARAELVSHGLIVDLNVHYGSHGIKGENDHAHLMTTMRPLNGSSFGKKARHLNSKAQLERWRRTSAEYANRALKRAGFQARVDHRSLAKQGLNRYPTIHLGLRSTALEKKGVGTPRGDENRRRAQENSRIAGLEAELAQLLSEQESLLRGSAPTLPTKASLPARLGGLAGTFVTGLQDAREARKVAALVEAEIARIDALRAEASPAEGVFLQAYRTSIFVASGSFDDRKRQANRDAVKAYAIEERGLDDVMALLKFATADRSELDRVVMNLWDDPQVRKKMEEAEADRHRERQAEAARKAAFNRAESERQDALARTRAEASVRLAPEQQKAHARPHQPLMPSINSSSHIDSYDSPKQEAGEAEQQQPESTISPALWAAVKRDSSRGR